MASKVVLLIPLARYYNYLEAHTSSDAWPKIVEMILSTTADILERMQNKEAILLLSSSEKVMVIIMYQQEFYYHIVRVMLCAGLIQDTSCKCGCYFMMIYNDNSWQIKSIIFF